MPPKSKKRQQLLEESSALDMQTLLSAIADLKSDNLKLRQEMDERFRQLQSTGSAQPLTTNSDTGSVILDDQSNPSVSTAAHMTSSTVPQSKSPIHEVSTTSVVSASAHAYKPFTGLFCEKFSGNTATVSAEEWIDIFDTVTEEFPVSARIRALARHLTDDALSWYSQERIRESTNWTTVCDKLLKRFGKSEINPICAATERTLRVSETVDSYYKEKRRLLIKAKIPDESQVALLTQGMPESYRGHLAASKLKSTDEWLETALAIESSKLKRFKKTDDSTFYINDSSSEQRDRKKRSFRRSNNWYQKKDDVPPPSPCPRCLRYGRREMHWKRQCHRTEPEVTQTTSQTSDNTSQAIHYLQSGPYVYYNISVNGQPVRAFLDTGSTITAISTETGKRLGLKPEPNSKLRVRQVNGETESKGKALPELEVKGTKQRFPVHIFYGVTFDALLGVDAFRAFKLVVRHDQLSQQTFAIQPTSGFMMTVDTPVHQRPLRPTQRKHNVPIDVKRFRTKQHVIGEYRLRHSKVVNGLTKVSYNGRERTVVPPSLVLDVIRMYYDADHPSIGSTLRRISHQYWWPTKAQDVCRYASTARSGQVLGPGNVTDVTNRER